MTALMIEAELWVSFASLLRSYVAAAKRRIKQLETELAVARKINEVFLKEGISPKGSSR